MNAISFTTAAENLASTMDSVCDDREPVVITRERSQPVVMISMDDYRSLTEAAHLLRSPENARRLNEAIDSLERGEGIAKDFAELSQ